MPWIVILLEFFLKKSKVLRSQRRTAGGCSSTKLGFAQFRLREERSDPERNRGFLPAVSLLFFQKRGRASDFVLAKTNEG